jgi:hypothetical protein
VLGLAFNIGHGATVDVLVGGPRRARCPVEEIVDAEVGVPSPLELRLGTLGLEQLGEAAEVGVSLDSTGAYSRSAT